MISKEIEEKLEKSIQSLGCELYDISFLKEDNIDILRVSIMAKDSKTTLDKCQEVSEMISPLLDVYEPMSGKYTLEVSSPGIERILKTPRHFELSIGERVQVKINMETKASETQEKETFEAIIKSADSKGVGFKIINSQDFACSKNTSEGNITDQVEEKFYPYHLLKKVKTIFDW